MPDNCKHRVFVDGTGHIFWVMRQLEQHGIRPILYVQGFSHMQVGDFFASANSSSVGNYIGCTLVQCIQEGPGGQVETQFATFLSQGRDDLANCLGWNYVCFPKIRLDDYVIGAKQFNSLEYATWTYKSSLHAAYHRHNTGSVDNIIPHAMPYYGRFIPSQAMLSRDPKDTAGDDVRDDMIR